jgi:hypothetical protein
MEFRCCDQEISARLETFAFRTRSKLTKSRAFDPWTQDCVDQAENGTSYAIVWAEYQSMRFHRPYDLSLACSPTSIRACKVGDGDVLAFDLYHRSDGIGQGLTDPSRARSEGRRLIAFSRKARVCRGAKDCRPS